MELKPRRKKPRLRERRDIIPFGNGRKGGTTTKWEDGRADFFIRLIYG